MKIYGIIPARSGSKNIKDKNIHNVGGYPLLAYSIVASNLCEKIDETIVTTDSDNYKKIARKYDATVSMRHGYSCSDEAIDIDYLLPLIFKKKMDPNDLICLLRPTTPLRSINKIKHAIEQYDRECESLRSIHQTNVVPEKTFKFIDDDKKEIEPYMDIAHIDAYKPRQLYEDCYDPNGYIDIIAVSTILKTKTAYGTKVMGYVTEPVIEIDSKNNLEYLKYYIEKNNPTMYKYLKENYEPTKE